MNPLKRWSLLCESVKQSFFAYVYSWKSVQQKLKKSNIIKLIEPNIYHRKTSQCGSKKLAQFFKNHILAKKVIYACFYQISNKNGINLNLKHSMHTQFMNKFRFFMYMYLYNIL